MHGFWCRHSNSRRDSLCSIELTSCQFNLQQKNIKRKRILFFCLVLTFLNWRQWMRKIAQKSIFDSMELSYLKWQSIGCTNAHSFSLRKTHIYSRPPIEVKCFNEFMWIEEKKKQHVMIFFLKAECKFNVDYWIKLNRRSSLCGTKNKCPQ